MTILLPLIVALVIIYAAAMSIILYHLFKYRLPKNPLLLSHQPKDKTNLIAGLFIVVSTTIIGIIIFLILNAPWGEMERIIEQLLKK